VGSGVCGGCGASGGAPGVGEGRLSSIVCVASLSRVLCFSSALGGFVLSCVPAEIVGSMAPRLRMSVDQQIVQALEWSCCKEATSKIDH